MGLQGLFEPLALDSAETNRRVSRRSIEDRARVSGPLMDRVDIHVDVPALTYDEIADRQISGPTSAEVRCLWLPGYREAV